jgi:hypothetical protein
LLNSVYDNLNFLWLVSLKPQILHKIKLLVLNAFLILKFVHSLIVDCFLFLKLFLLDMRYEIFFHELPHGLSVEELLIARQAYISPSLIALIVNWVRPCLEKALRAVDCATEKAVLHFTNMFIAACATCYGSWTLRIFHVFLFDLI